MATIYTVECPAGVMNALFDVTGGVDALEPYSTAASVAIAIPTFFLASITYYSIKKRSVIT